MLTNIDFYSYVNYINELQNIPNNLILTLAENSDNKVRDLLMLAPKRFENCSFDTQEYVKNFIEQLNNLFKEDMTEVEKKLYLLFLLKDWNINQDTISMFEEVNNLEINQNSWQFIFKQAIQYDLLNYYLRLNIKDKLKELLIELQPNNQVFKETWAKFKDEAMNSIKD